MALSQKLPGMMPTKHATKHGAQNLNHSTTNTPSKPVKSKIPKPNETREVMEEDNHSNVQEMFKLDMIDQRMESIETKMKETKGSLEFVHKEVQDLKKENDNLKKSEGEFKERLQKLGEINITLKDRIIDLQARSMRDNLIF